MRAIGTIPSERDAQKLADYLLTLNVTTRLERLSDGCRVWVLDEEHVEGARQELEEFLKNPGERKYQAAARVAERLRKQEAQAERRYRENVVDVRSRWAQASVRRCPLTFTLIALSVLVALASNLGNEYDPVLHYLFITKFIDAGLIEISRGEIWRFVTPIFIHFGLLHLVLNLWWLYDLGGQLEMRRGKIRLALLVIVIAVASNLAQYVWSGPNFGGMSGVVYGLFGYIWIKSRHDPASGLYLAQDTVTLMIIWLFLCMTGLVGPIANAAHVAGLVVGAVWGNLPSLWGRLRRR